MKLIQQLGLYFFCLSIHAQQPTVGLLYNDNAVSDGYVLFSPLTNNEVFLINTCGEKIRQWSFTEIPGATCYLLANGNLLRAGKDHLEIRDWDNNVIWTYETTTNGLAQHHDITPLPNGNILCIVSDVYTLAEMTAKGRNPSITGATMKFEKVVEIQPIGTNSATIVWQWKLIDHVIQDFDSAKENYGVVENHSELLDLNYNSGYPTDYVHFNGIDYNANLDQIIVSARHLSEIYIIDHSTTTAQASSHLGGNSNKGGDFLWRWGNPQVYRKGNESNRKLFMQHNPMWVENGYLDQGKITVFNNGDPASAQTYSSVHILQPDIISGNYTMTNEAFNPVDYEWSWNGSILGSLFQQERQSGTQSLPNGNMIISEAILGRVSEITKSGTLLWSYKNPAGPLVNGLVNYYNQNSTENSAFFKAEKYPADFSGFVGKDMTALGIIEDTNTLSFQCNGSLANEENAVETITILNPIQNATITFDKTVELDKIEIIDLYGRVVFEETNFNDFQLQTDLSIGVYYLKIRTKTATQIFTVSIDN